MKNVIILASASDDLEQLRLFYEAQQAGIGEHCIDRVLSSVTSLAHRSGIHSRRQQYYRMIEKTFHLGIYYREHGDDVLVVAILNLRRDPHSIRKQLRQR